ATWVSGGVEIIQASTGIDLTACQLSAIAIPCFSRTSIRRDSFVSKPMTSLNPRRSRRLMRRLPIEPRPMTRNFMGKHHNFPHHRASYEYPREQRGTELFQAHLRERSA